ncbi:MAG: proline dehydrogenase family protein [Bacteroidetes bacterium]|nr:proline dehydrogenase family protein [Bacteroidota bacterium]
MLPQFDNTEIAFRYKNSKDLKQAQFLFSSMGSQALTSIGIKLTTLALNLRLPIEGIIKRTIFRQFCGGETMQEAAQTADTLDKYGVGIILDYGVEGKENEVEYDKAVPEFIKAIQYAASQKNIPFVSVKVTGFARFALMEQVHNRVELSQAEKEEWARVGNRIAQIGAAAHQYKVMLLVDAEETWIQDAVNDLIDPLMEKYNQEEAIIFNTFQLYCHGTLPYLKQMYNEAKSKGYILGAKLVRGAYMEKERARAAEMNYPSPIQPNKVATDHDYDESVHFCLEHLSNISLFIGTHNEQSCLLAAKYMDEHGLQHNHPRVYFSQLFGMSDNISFNMANAGFHVAKYLPYGPVRDVMPYLMRRAQENTSVAGQTGRELLLINKELKRRKS